VTEAEVRTADPGLRSFVNVNTLEELEAAEETSSPARAGGRA
jgi:molybdopterin-guanine dinucleotide biosynthesis protein A